MKLLVLHAIIIVIALGVFGCVLFRRFIRWLCE